MKKIFILLFGAIAAFTSCEKNESETGASDDSTMAKTNLTLAYVNSDSLASNYLYFEEVTKQLDEIKVKYEKEFANRATGLQRQIENFQKTANNMTIAQARAIEEDLTRKQQNLQQYQQTLTQDLLREEAKLNKKLYEAVAKYLENYGQENGLDFIFKHSAGGEIWYGDSSMDITGEIIKGLNNEYNAGELDAETDSTDSTTVN
jgi:outer membrane protein